MSHHRVYRPVMKGGHRPTEYMYNSYLTAIAGGAFDHASRALQ